MSNLRKRLHWEAKNGGHSEFDLMDAIASLMEKLDRKSDSDMGGAKFVQS